MKGVFCYANKVALELTYEWNWLPGEPIMWLQGRKFQYYSNPWGGENWRLNQQPVGNDLINHTYVKKPPQKPKEGVLRASGSVNTLKFQESGKPEEGMKALYPLP